MSLMMLSCQEASSGPDDGIQLQSAAELKLSIIDGEKIALSWIDRSQGELGYQLERQDTSEYSIIAILPENATAFLDTSAIYGVLNRYRISLLDTGTDSLVLEGSVPYVYLDTDWSTVPGGAYHFGQSGTLWNDLDEDYDIMTFEVTNSQFVQFLNEAIRLGTITVPGSLPIGVYEGDEHWPAADRMAADVNDPDTRMVWNGIEFSVLAGHENKPVSEVSWFGAYFFARHFGLALPTEHEWEKAARGMSDDPYPWGDTPLNCELANTSGCTARLVDAGFTQGASPFGARDMIGNVWEWVDDFMGPDNPHRVIKGGSCNSTTVTTFVYSRNSDDAWHTSYFYGFRCIRRS